MENEPELVTGPLTKTFVNVNEPELTTPPVMRAAMLLDSTNIVPELTTLLLIAPRCSQNPVLVTGPLRYASAEKLTVAALLTPPLTVAPTTAFVSNPVPATTSWPAVN